MESTLIRFEELVRSKRWDFDYFSPAFKSAVQKIHESGWEVKYLKDIILDLTDGQHGYLKHVSEGIPLLRTTNLFEDEIRLDDLRYIAPDVHANIKRSQLRSGDVLLATIGVTLGTAAVFDGSIGEANINQNLVKITPKPEINPLYLSLFLNSKLGRLQTHVSASKSVVPIISYSRLGKLLIPVPPRSLQDQIAQVMQEAYGDRQKKLLETQQLLNSIDSFILEALDIKFDDLSHEKRFTLASRALTKNRFDVDFHLPETHDKYEAVKRSRKCRVTSLGTLIEQIANGATPKGANYLNEGIPFFRIQNIVPDGLDLSDIAYISRQTHNEMKRSQTRPGDLLMTITGRVGTAAVIPNSIDEGNINQHIVIIRLKPGAINTNYLATVINSSAVSFQANHRTTGTTRIALDYTAIKSLLIPVPTIEIQEQILGEVAHRRHEAKRLRNEAKAVVTSAKTRVERMILGEEIVEKSK